MRSFNLLASCLYASIIKRLGINCHRHTPEEIKKWCQEAGLTIEHMNAQEAGITVVAVK